MQWKAVNFYKGWFKFSNTGIYNNEASKSGLLTEVKKKANKQTVRK